MTKIYPIPSIPKKHYDIEYNLMKSIIYGFLCCIIILISIIVLLYNVIDNNDGSNLT